MYYWKKDIFNDLSSRRKQIGCEPVRGNYDYNDRLNPHISNPRCKRPRKGQNREKIYSISQKQPRLYNNVMMGELNGEFKERLPNCKLPL